MLLDALGVNPEALIEFVASKKPSYVEFEKFFAAHATNLNAASIAEINAAVAGYQHADETRQSILASVGLPDGKATDAVNLNNLDDWQEFYASEIA
jgi:deoxyribose-phosphate aldolase